MRIKWERGVGIKWCLRHGQPLILSISSHLYLSLSLFFFTTLSISLVHFLSFSFLICERILFPLDLQADVCARVQGQWERVAGRLGSLDPLGCSISFRALYTAAVLLDNLHYWLVAKAFVCFIDVYRTLDVKSWFCEVSYILVAVFS